ncbi:hypothetical protein HC362_21645 [Streptomyces sp. 891-h]|nr:hypothetical protein HC362_21645 [Streptomyces sp. 891-h]
MALIALAADKGAPGVTTAAVALSAVWPRRALLAEMDTAGGDLVYRSPATDGRPLDPNTGLLSLAATARRGLAPEQLWDHAQRLSGGLEVLVGLGNAEQSAGLAGQWDTLGRAFATLGDSPHPQLAADVIADCGRIGPEAASVALFPHAALVLLVARDEPEQIARVRDRALALTNRLHGAGRGMTPLAQPLLGVLLVCQAQGAAKVAGQVNDMLVASRAGAQVMGVLAHDPLGAEQLAGRRRGRVERSLLVRSVRKIATDLHQQYGAAWASAAVQPPSRRPAQGPGHDQRQGRSAGPAPAAGRPTGPAETLPPGPAAEAQTPNPPPPHTPTGRPGAADRPGAAPGPTAPPPQGPPRQGPPPPAGSPYPTRGPHAATGPQTTAGPQAATRTHVTAGPPTPPGEVPPVEGPRPRVPGALPPVQAPSVQAATPDGSAQGRPGEGERARGIGGGLKGLRGRHRPPAPAPAPTPPVPLPGSGEQPRDEGAAS